jgi:hypothetical protein
LNDSGIMRKMGSDPNSRYFRYRYGKLGSDPLVSG